MTQRTFSELQHYLDSGMQALLDGLRHAGVADRSFRQSQVDAAVRFCAKVFGEYASLVGKARLPAPPTQAAEVAGTADTQGLGPYKVEIFDLELFVKAQSAIRLSDRRHNCGRCIAAVFLRTRLRRAAAGWWRAIGVYMVRDERGNACAA